MSNFGFSPVDWSYWPLVINQVSLPTPTSISGNFSISISPKWYDKSTITWTVPSDWGNVTFNIYAGPMENGPYTKLNPTVLSSPQFVDLKAEVYSKFENRWYVVEAIFPNGQTVQSPPTTLDNLGTSFVNLRITEIQRREWLLLRKFVGVEVLLFRRKVYGTRCHECYNEDTKRVDKDRCLTCYGTSWEGGYYEPLTTLVQFEATPNDIVLGYTGKQEPNQIQAWTIAFPEMLDLDLIFRVADKRMYRIDKVHFTELAIKSVKQTILLTELSKESVEYRLILNP